MPTNTTLIHPPTGYPASQVEIISIAEGVKPLPKQPQEKMLFSVHLYTVDSWLTNSHNSTSTDTHKLWNRRAATQLLSLQLLCWQMPLQYLTHCTASYIRVQHKPTLNVSDLPYRHQMWNLVSQSLSGMLKRSSNTVCTMMTMFRVLHFAIQCISMCISG